MPRLSQPTRSISLFQAVAIMVGIMIGSGIYESSPVIAASIQSDSLLVGFWILGGIISLCGALVYAKLGSLYPEEGGDYVYLSKAYGPWVGFLFAWAHLIIIQPGSIAAMAFPVARYGLAIFGESSPEAVVTCAAFIVLLVTFSNALGAKVGKLTQLFLVIVKISALFLVIGCFALNYGSSANRVFEEGGEHDYGLALVLILFTFGGWSEIAFVAGEIERLERNLLRSMLIAIGVVTIAYIGVTLAFLSLLSQHGSNAALFTVAQIGELALPGYGGKLAALLVAGSALGALNGLIFTGARVTYVLGRDYRLFSVLDRWDEGLSTPTVAIWVQGVIAILIVLISRSFQHSIIYSTAVVWIFFLLTAASIFKFTRAFRISKDTTKNSELDWLTFIACIIFIVSCLYLIYSALNYSPGGTAISLVILILGFLPYWLSSKVSSSANS